MGEAVTELRTPSSSRTSTWHITLCNSNKNASPDSGYREAAMVGSLGICLGGPGTYAGIPSLKSFISEAINRFVKNILKKQSTYCIVLPHLQSLGQRR